MSWRGTRARSKLLVRVTKPSTQLTAIPISTTPNPAIKPHKLNPIQALLPLDRVYAFDPIPPGLPADEIKLVLGGQGQVWTPYIPNIDYLEYMTFPRECALAEDFWTSPMSKNYPQFLDRLKVHLDRLKFMQINFRHPDAPTT